MGQEDRAAGPLTFRKPWGRKISAAVWAVAALGIVLEVSFTRWDAFTSFWTPWLAIISWTAYMQLWRSRLTITESGLEVCNGDKTHYIPFTAIEDIQNPYRFVITAHGKKYNSQVGVLPDKVAVGAQATEDPVTTAWLNGRFAQGQHGTRVVTHRNYALLVLGALPIIWFFTIWLQWRPDGFN